MGWAWQIAAIVISYAVAAYAAGLFLVLPVAAGRVYDHFGERGWLSTIVPITLVEANLFAVYIGMFALPYFFLAIIILRYFRRRDLLSYALASVGVSALSMSLFVSSTLYGGRFGMDEALFFGSLTAAGAVAGVAYGMSFKFLYRGA